MSELQVRAIATVEAAHAFLPEFIADFNRRFGRPRPTRSWRRPPRDLPVWLACRYRRVVARDNTVRLGVRWVQLRGARSYVGLTVDVHELLDGRLVVLHEGLVRGATPAPAHPFVLKPRRSPGQERRRPRRPHPAAGPRAPARPRTTPKTHTGRHPLPTHPWVIAMNGDIRARERRTGRTFSRSSEGHFH